MADISRVIDESRRFRAKVSTLLDRYRGSWVLFRDDAVQGTFDDEEAAYLAGVQRFGTKGGFVVGFVDEDAGKAVPVSSSLFFSK